MAESVMGRLGVRDGSPDTIAEMGVVALSRSVSISRKTLVSPKRRKSIGNAAATAWPSHICHPLLPACTIGATAAWAAMAVGPVPPWSMPAIIIRDVSGGAAGGMLKSRWKMAWLAATPAASLPSDRCRRASRQHASPDTDSENNNNWGSGAVPPAATWHAVATAVAKPAATQPRAVPEPHAVISTPAA
ncbi:hypothetical protein [Arthrobacter dokdonensis]|uniref:hypothetical protein n=1 Tax=Arthrobacter dokdonellae TaxID=2211210 RepID=UPI001013C36B|nr:hypothetical protein [Arthrobacter dokdonellae]